jgi:hypothetical protein
MTNDEIRMKKELVAPEASNDEAPNELTYHFRIVQGYLLN